MTSDPLLSCRVKLARANKHREDLQRQIDSFAKRKPHEIITDKDSEPGVRINRVHIAEDIPTDFAGYIGDCIHNLRSALDALATILAVRHIGGPLSEGLMRDIAFPIHSSAIGFTEAIDRAPFEIRAKELIRSMEPYRGGRGEILWALHRMDIVDKHRAILAVDSALEGVIYQTIAGGLSASERRIYPLKEGDILSRFTANDPEYDSHAHFTFGVVFAEGEAFAGEEVLDALEKMTRAVEWTILVIARDIFGIRL